MSIEHSTTALECVGSVLAIDSKLGNMMFGEILALFQVVKKMEAVNSHFPLHCTGECTVATMWTMHQYFARNNQQ